MGGSHLTHDLHHRATAQACRFEQRTSSHSIPTVAIAARPESWGEGPTLKTQPWGITLPGTNSLPLKMDGWNTIVSFWGPAYFQVRTVSFRECINHHDPLATPPSHTSWGIIYHHVDHDPLINHEKKTYLHSHETSAIHLKFEDAHLKE